MKNRDKEREVIQQDIPKNLAVGTGVVATTMVDNGVNITKVTLTDFAVGAAVGAASLGFGAKVLTFPKGKIHVLAVNTALTIKSNNANNDAKSPIIGFGTVVASGAVAALTGTATFEDIITGAAMGQLTGTTGVAVAYTKNGELDIKDGSSTAKDMYLNCAIDWAAAGTIVANGTITVIWANLT